jgi:uracil-DNA glycosylase family 4
VKYVPSEGPRQTNIVIIGEAPGADEERQGRPFVGYSGMYLRDHLHRAGIDPDKAFITNVCHYRPPGNQISKFFKSFSTKMIPNELVLKGILELYNDLADIRPNVIVPLGNVALWSLTGLKQIGRRRGSILEAQAHLPIFEHLHAYDPMRMEEAALHFKHIQGRKVIPTLHPAAVLRKGDLRVLFDFDLARISKEVDTPDLNVPRRLFHIDPVRTTTEKLVQRLLESGPYAVDIECVGGRLFCIAFSSDPHETLVLTPHEQWRRDLIRVLLTSDNPKTFQNGVFDCSFLERFEGIRVNNYAYDIMFAHHAAYPELRRGLDLQTSLYTREPYYKDEGKDWDPRDANDVQAFLTYNAKDAAVTREIQIAQEGDELKDIHYRETAEFRMAQTPAIIDMMVRGIRVDTEELRRIRREKTEELALLQKTLDEGAIRIMQSRVKKRPHLLPQVHSLLEWMASNADSQEGALNVNSYKRLAEFLYDVCGYPTRTKHKSRTTNEMAIKSLYGLTKDPLLLLIVHIRQIRKLLSSYLNIKLDGDRTYFSVNPVGTKTGRWSISKTIHGYGCNMQTIPKELRSIFVPDPGNVFGYFDLSQAEDRVVSYLAGVREKITAFEEGRDVHALTASHLFNKPPEEVTPEERYLGKQCNHAFNYKEGYRTFKDHINMHADVTGVSISEALARQLRDAHLAAYPEIEWYWAWVEKQLRHNRTLINPFGFKRVFLGNIGDDAVLRDAYSWIPQSTAPDIVNRAMISIYRDLREEGVRVVLQVHDALLVEIPEDKVDLIAPEIVRRMTIPIVLNDTTITIPVDYSIGHNWKEAS